MIEKPIGKRRVCLALATILIAAGIAAGQTKTLPDAEAQIRGFENPAAFSLYYDDARYVTVAGVKIDILDEESGLRKILKTFEWQLSSMFALKGIDTKPVRTVLCINSQGKTFQFARDNDLTIFLPGEDVSLGAPNRTSEIRRGRATETLCWETNPEIVGELAGADSVEFQLGTVRTSIRRDKLPLLRDYGKLVKVE